MFFGLIALAYLGIGVVAVLLALWLVQGLVRKVVAATIIAALFAIWPATSIVKERSQQKDFLARRDAATALFDARCKSAGEKIARTVDNVNGVVWMKWRDKQDNLSDQFRLDDPYGHDCGGDACIEQLLRLENTKGRFAQEVERRKGGYRYVESIDPADGKKYRYVGAMVPRWSDEAVAKYRAEKGKDPDDDFYWFKSAKSEIASFSVRYGITWDDISTREDREHWIAGGTLKVVDLETNEVIGQRVGYMMDRGLGSEAGFRSPWGAAPDWACPSFPRSAGGRAFRSNRGQAFILSVLKPTKEQ